MLSELDSNLNLQRHDILYQGGTNFYYIILVIHILYIIETTFPKWTYSFRNIYFNLMQRFIECLFFIDSACKDSVLGSDLILARIKDSSG